MIPIFIVVFLIIILFVGVFLYKRKQNVKLTATQQQKLLVITAEWCGYCKKIKPTLKKIQQEFPESMTWLDADDVSHEYMKNNNVRGFPFIALVRSDNTIIKKYPMNGNRSFESLCSFAKLQ